MSGGGEEKGRGRGKTANVRETSLSLVQLSSRLESVCNFALQLEGEVQAGQHAHTQLEEQYEALSQVGSHLCLLPLLYLSRCVCAGEGRSPVATGGQRGSSDEETPRDGKTSQTGLGECQHALQVCDICFRHVFPSCLLAVVWWLW